MSLKRIVAGMSAAVLLGSISASETILFEENFHSPESSAGYRREAGTRYSPTGGRGNSGCLFLSLIHI